ncbi:MAG: hypothetical protein NW241_01225 [Bacteroidia bacterium]|nr:hypothetical protein [Bacteroidia bacterium]
MKSYWMKTLLCGLLCAAWAGSTAQSSRVRIVNTRTTAEEVQFKQLDYLQAEQLPGLNFRYTGKLDGEDFTVSYQVLPRLKTVSIQIRSAREGAGGLRYQVREDANGLLQFEIQLNGQPAGSAQNQQAGQPVYIKASPALLSSKYFDVLLFLPHEMAGFAPQDLFAPDADADPDMQAMGLKLGKFLGKLLGGIKLGGSCAKKTTVSYICSQACVQPVGSDGCPGSFCGNFCCCGSCEERIVTERECGGEVSVGN